MIATRLAMNADAAAWTYHYAGGIGFPTTYDGDGMIATPLTLHHDDGDPLAPTDGGETVTVSAGGPLLVSASVHVAGRISLTHTFEASPPRFAIGLRVVRVTHGGPDAARVVTPLPYTGTAPGLIDLNYAQALGRVTRGPVVTASDVLFAVAGEKLQLQALLMADPLWDHDAALTIREANLSLATIGATGAAAPALAGAIALGGADPALRRRRA